MSGGRGPPPTVPHKKAAPNWQSHYENTSRKPSGTHPVNSFPSEMNIHPKLLSWPSSAGISPVNALPLRSSPSKLLRLPSSAGISPVNALLFQVQPVFQGCSVPSCPALVPPVSHPLMRCNLGPAFPTCSVCLVPPVSPQLICCLQIFQVGEIA